ncbi:MAG: hypothetical protein A4S09_17340 [Proteobacteria bacterium SG_bin7]|nr:MAG: hypothetical protein A4S09_17340 [Proteobacteria bacterium SG_bin7]
MRNEILATICFVFLSSSAYADGTDQIKQLCKDEWTKAGTLDEQMYTHCLKRQAEGIAEIKTIQNEFNGKNWFENMSGPNCFKKWTKRDAINYEMVAHCMKSEKEGYLNTKYQYDKKDKSVAVDCLINQMTSETPMEMSAYCIKNYSASEKAKADSLMTQYAQANPNVQGVKGARNMIEGVFFGKQDKPVASTLPQLPDVTNLVPQQQVAPQKTANNDSAKSPGMVDKVKGWFSDSNSKSSGCPEEKAQANFIATCKAALEYSAMTVSAQRNPSAESSMCRCIALNFSVEKAANPPACDFTFQDVYAIKRMDKVYVKCGE